MSHDFDGAADYFSMATPIAAMPLTMACWFNADTVTTRYALMSIVQSHASQTERLRMLADGSVAGDPIVADARNTAGASANAATSTSFTAGAWHHACTVFNSTTDRRAYLNGGGKITNTTSISFSGVVSQLTVGATLFNAALANPHAGLIALAAAWDVALSDAEIAALAGGDHPLTVQRANLRHLSPLSRSTVILGTGTLTTNGAPALNDASDPTVDRWMPPFRHQLQMQGMA